MPCGLCGSEYRGVGGSADVCLPFSKRTVAALLGEAGHPVSEQALLCDACVSAVNELEWAMTRVQRATAKVKERAGMKDPPAAQQNGSEQTAADATDPAAGSGRPTDPTSDTGDRRSPPPTDRPARTKIKRRVRGWVNPRGHNAEPLNGAVVPGDGTLPVDPSAVKQEPGEPMDESGSGGGGDGPAMSDGEQSRLAADPSDADIPLAPKNPKVFKKPDWNERWRDKTLKNTSWRNTGRVKGKFSEIKRAILAGQMRDIMDPEAPGAEQGADAEPEGAASASTGDVDGGGDGGEGGGDGDGNGDAAAQVPAAKNIFRVGGRKVVTKQRDGSATPAVKVMRPGRHGQPAVSFMDHRAAIRQAERMERAYQRLNDPPPEKRKRPRFLTKPPAEGDALPAEVAWMAGEASDAQPWLAAAAAGAVHAVLEVQPGEEWVDAIVRSEAAQDWPAGDAPQLPVPLANIKSEPAE